MLRQQADRKWLARMVVLLFIVLCSSLAFAGETRPAITHSILIDDLQDYSSYPKPVQELILEAAKMTEQNLTYLYGSANPKRGGMDCSGTIYYLLRGLNNMGVPRDSAGIYKWVKEKGKLYEVSGDNLNAAEFKNLRPGDLLFWTGTYRAARKLSISHVMLYLGKNKQGRPVMFGSSDGRTYNGQSMWGVSEFDLLMPRPGSTARFVGYGCIPDLTCVLQGKSTAHS